MIRFTILLITIGSALVVYPASASVAATDVHPLMYSKYAVKVGLYAPSRRFDASARGSTSVVSPLVDFERSLNANDQVRTINIDMGWRFSENWGFTIQHFGTDRGAQTTLDSTFDWNGLTYEAGVDISARSKTEITRLFFSRDYRDGARHSLRIGAGVHYIETSAEISGVATLDDASREFRRSVVSASLPIPNIGAWYRYSPSARWLLSARADWFSADVGDYSGLIWNIAVSADYALTDHIGIGLSYQFVELDGAISDTRWRGSLRTKFDGPVINLTGFW
jgi:opacity protein-like surface antigen